MDVFEGGSYLGQWHELRRATRRLWSVCLAGPPSVIALFILVQLTLPSLALVVGPLAAVAILALYILTARRRMSFPCPRCGALYFWSSWGVLHPASRRCQHCGLVRWSEPGESLPALHDNGVH